MCEVLINLIRERDEALAAVKAAESIIQAAKSEVQAAKSEVQAAKKDRYFFLDIVKAFYNGADSLEKLIAAGFDEAIAKEFLSYFD